MLSVRLWYALALSQVEENVWVAAVCSLIKVNSSSRAALKTELWCWALLPRRQDYFAGSYLTISITGLMHVCKWNQLQIHTIFWLHISHSSLLESWSAKARVSVSSLPNAYFWPVRWRRAKAVIDIMKGRIWRPVFDTIYWKQGQKYFQVGLDMNANTFW